jgi:predicted MFS family arabinose efflux permease
VLMTGVLVGILLARTVSGFVGARYGWRFMYGAAAVVMVIDGFVLLAQLPHHPPSLRMGYGRLMHSMIDLLRDHPPLWTASIVSGLSFAGFMAFWTALSYLMKAQFNLGSTEAGLFGIVGVVGAMAAPLAGKLSDRKGPAFTVTLSLAASAAAFGLMWVWLSIPGLIVGVLLMDVGVQSIQVASQSEVISLVPAARSRVNTLYMVARFMGGAAGSAIGATAWTRYQWPGVCAASIAMVILAAVVHLAGTHRPPTTAT